MPTNGDADTGADCDPDQQSAPLALIDAVCDGSPLQHREPVRRAGERPGPEVALEAADLGSPNEQTARLAELPQAAVAAGFLLEPVGNRVRLFHHCGNVVRVGNPTDPQLRWYIRVHRCGPPTSEWHIGVIEQPSRRNPATPAHLIRGGSTPRPHDRGPRAL